MRINTVVLPRDSEEGGSVHVVFSRLALYSVGRGGGVMKRKRLTCPV